MKNAIKILLIVLVISLLGLGYVYYSKLNVSGSEQSSYNTYINDANKQYELKEYSQALKLYSQAADLIPTNKEPYLKIVEILLLKNQINQAADIVEKSSSYVANVDRYDLYMILADSYYANNQYDLAEKHYRNAQNINDNNKVLVALGKVSIKMGDTTKAEEYLKRVNNTEYDYYAQARLLLSYLKLEDIAAAKEFIKSADVTLVQDPAISADIKAYSKILDSLATDTLYNATYISKEFVNKGYPYLATKVLETKAEQMGEYYDGLYILSRAFYSIGKYQSAIDLLTNAISLENNYASHLLLAESYMGISDQEKAFTYFGKAVGAATGSNQVNASHEYVNVLLKLSLYSQAKVQLDKIGKVSDATWISLGYVEMYYNQKNYAKMSTYLDKLAKENLSDGEKKEYLRYKVMFDIETDKLTLAKQDLETLKAIDRYNTYYYLLAGRVALIENNLEEAESMLNKAIEYDFVGESTEAAKKLLDRVK